VRPRRRRGWLQQRRRRTDVSKRCGWWRQRPLRVRAPGDGGSLGTAAGEAKEAGAALAGARSTGREVWTATIVVLTALGGLPRGVVDPAALPFGEVDKASGGTGGGVRAAAAAAVAAPRRCGEGVLSRSSRRCCSSIFDCTKSWWELVKARMLLICTAQCGRTHRERDTHASHI
jgi:hypothetical protein